MYAAQSKTLVFLSTCKQVRFVYEAFCKLRPGVSLRHLHGKMKQYKRMVIFNDFNEVYLPHLPPATHAATVMFSFSFCQYSVSSDVCTLCPAVVDTQSLHYSQAPGQAYVEAPRIWYVLWQVPTPLRTSLTPPLPTRKKGGGRTIRLCLTFPAMFAAFVMSR